MTRTEVTLVKQVLNLIEDMLQATNLIPGVRYFEVHPGRGIGTTWMQVPRGRESVHGISVKRYWNEALISTPIKGRLQVFRFFLSIVGRSGLPHFVGKLRRQR